MNGTERNRIRPGTEVLIELKKDQASGRLTRGIVKDVLTRSPTHPHGIKVRLAGGEIGRVKVIPENGGPVSGCRTVARDQRDRK